jgi:hypothetical protein
LNTVCKVIKNESMTCKIVLLNVRIVAMSRITAE